MYPEIGGQRISLLEKFTYGYGKAGNRTSVTTGSANTNYPSNQLNQTTAEQGFGPTVFSGTLDEPARVTVNGQSATVMSDGGAAPYTFEALVDLAEGSNTVTIEATDGSGNTATKRYFVTTGGVQKTLEYDLNGNLRYEKDASGTVLREFQWDAKNRLVKIIDGTKESEFVYDGLDRRVRIIEKENAVVQSNETYLWANGDILQKRASNGQTVQRSYFADGFEEGSSDYFVTRDHLGSVREVIASNGQTVEAVYDYSPWGEVTKTGGTGAESDFLYTGHLYHEPSDLHMTLYRAYNPELGMWLSRDPIAENGGINFYAYVGNNPANWWDPLGLEVCVGARGLNNPFIGDKGVHTFVEIRTDLGTTTYGGYKDGNRLAVRKNDLSDAGGNPDKGYTIVPAPLGMTQSQWDQAVIDSGERELLRDSEREYNPFGGDGGNQSGNCNSTTSDIIEGAGGSLPPGFNPPGANPGLRVAPRRAAGGRGRR
jgi:RHS repeat-associated protein